MTCQTCPNPANCSPTFCQFNDVDLPVTMYEPPEQPPMSPSLARQANERNRRLEAGRAHLLTITDKPGNWWDKRGLFGKLATVVSGVVACWLVAVLVVPR